MLGDVETVPFRTPEGEKPGSQSRGSPVEGVSKAHAGQIYRLMNRLFRNEDELEKFLYEHLDTSLRSFSRGGSLQSSNYELITTMGRHGKMADLIEALHKFEPENFELTEIVQKLEFKLGHNGS